MWDVLVFFFSSRMRHTSWPRDWSSDVCSSDLMSCFLSGFSGFCYLIFFFIFFLFFLFFFLNVFIDRKSVVLGKSVDIGGRRIITKKTIHIYIFLFHHYY